MKSSKNNSSLLNLALTVILVFLSFSVLGLIVGIFVGRSGSDPTVVAALVPAVLTLVGGVIIFKSEETHPIIGSISVILLAIFILWGAAIGGADSQADAHGSKLRWFEQCSTEEMIINLYRENLLGLAPLKSEAFCG